MTHIPMRKRRSKRREVGEPEVCQKQPKIPEKGPRWTNVKDSRCHSRKTPLSPIFNYIIIKS
jgi:hypothetical protein